MLTKILTSKHHLKRFFLCSRAPKGSTVLGRGPEQFSCLLAPRRPHRMGWPVCTATGRLGRADGQDMIPGRGALEVPFSSCRSGLVGSKITIAGGFLGTGQVIAT